ncbi:hypothetical protein ALQ76_200026 [Pseudomonas syringae pv. atrofaciens]|nr:hypothetical protein ALQ76_200026 [Pseudomonas syringae pv. atrofaciens]
MPRALSPFLAGKAMLFIINSLEDIALMALLYVVIVIFSVVRSLFKGEISNVFSPRGLFAIACCFLIVSFGLAFSYLGAIGAGVSGSGISEDGRETLDAMLGISQFCAYSGLACVLMALIQRLRKKKQPS